MSIKNCVDSPVNSSWGGRFNTSPDRLLTIFTDSERFDRKLFHEDILASRAHAKMLGRQGIISSEEAQLIMDGLARIEKEIEEGAFTWREELEDVHMNIESRLVEIIGETGKKLHTGRSRNDQVGLTFRLYVAKSLKAWHESCVQLCSAIYAIASHHIDTIMPGFTHLQPAQPVSLAQHLLAYAGMFKRDAERIQDALKRVQVSPLGAAALAGSTFPLDPAFVASETGFEKIYANSMDAVSDRDFVMEALFIASVVMMHVSRLCEDIIVWATPAFGFVRLPDAFSTGSSIMPQKKNPDVAELARGKTGRVYGNLMALLTIMKGLPLTYNRDLQEDKESFFDSSETVIQTLTILRAMLERLEFQPEKMLKACQTGYLNATEIADYLASKGVPFREAHHLTGQIVALAERRNLPLERMRLEDFRQICGSIENDIFNVLDYKNAVSRRESPGGTGPNSVKRQLEEFAKWLEQEDGFFRK